MQPSSRTFSNQRIIVFMVILSFVCALILSILAAALQKPQEEARELDRSKQMLVAARIYNNADYFQIQVDGEYVPAKEVGGGRLVPGSIEDRPTKGQILAVVQSRIKPMLVDDQGNLHTFEEEKIDVNNYVTKNKKKGYASLPLKLVYLVLPNPEEGKQDTTPQGYVIPVSGFGLWDSIYGYIAIGPDGNHIIGISWYEQKETPGLGANITETPWQSLFPGKQIFQPDSSGNVNFQQAPIGITVVRGKVNEVLGTSPKALSAVDGMAGATLTGNGVTKAYKDSLSPYRPFFIRLQEQGKGK